MANIVDSLTQNKDIDYIARDFNSVVDSLVNFANVNFGPGTSANRLWTNFNTDSFSRNWLEIVAYVADVFFFYFDNQATQSYLQTATIRSAVRDIAKQFGFQPATAASASGDAIFTFSGAGTISRGFRVSSDSGVQFYVTNDIIAGAAGEFTGQVLQGQVKTETFSSTGIQNEEFDISAENVIIDDNALNPLDLTPQVTVNGNSYELVESFILNNGTDTPAVKDSLDNIIGGGGRVFQLEEHSDGTPFIRFGDGINGRKLSPGESITITYRTGGGTEGNIAKGSLTTMVDSLSFVTGVTNDADFSGGSDEQSIEQLRDLIPASLRTLERAVSQTDYSDIIVANFSEVFDASTEPNNVDPGIDVNIYVVPQGTGIAKISDNTLLLNRINSFIDRRKMVTIQFQILDAFGVDALISLEIFVSDTTSQTSVEQAIETALLDYFDLNTGGSENTGVGFAERILLKDINNLLQEIDGIDRFEIKKLTYRPRIEKNIQGLVTDYTSSEINIFQNISESEWLLAAAGSVTESTGIVIFDNANSESFTYDPDSGKIAYAAPVDLSGISAGDLFRNGPGVEEKVEIQTVGDGAGAKEITKITTVADEQGIQEVSEITTRDDSGGDLDGTYFLIYDIAGSVGVWFKETSGSTTQPSTGANRHIQVTFTSGDGAGTIASLIQAQLNADSQFSASVLSDTVTITNVNKADVFDATDGAIPTDFTFVTAVDGKNPASLGGNYFDIEGNSGIYRVWFDVDNGSSAPDLTGVTGVEVDVNSNDPASTVAAALQTELDLLADFNATVLNNEVTVEDQNVGIRADTQDGIPGTGFTFDILTQGADAVSIDGTYFILYDINGAIAFWFDVDDSGTTVPGSVPAGARTVEINTVTSGMSENDVAIEVEKAISASAPYTTALIEISKITTLPDVGDNLHSKYFLLNAANDSTEYYVWYNTSGTPGTGDPSLAGKTGIEVAITTNDTAISVASATATAIGLVADFSVSYTGGQDNLTVSNVTSGATTDLEDASTPNNTNFTLEVLTQGATFNTSISTNIIEVESDDKADISEAYDVDTGFTITVTQQGTSDDADFVILAVDLGNSELYILPNLPVNTSSPGPNAGGSVRTGGTSYESYKVYKKLLASATNLSVDSITDSSIDLSVLEGTGTALAATILVDDSQVFVPSEYATGNFYLIDGSGNIWEILANTASTLTTSVTAVNDASVTQVSEGDYKIVPKRTNSEILFNGSIFSIQYNSHNTFYSIGAQFIQIGTIGDEFEVSEEQNNLGRFGVGVDIISYAAQTGVVRFNESPDLTGINSEYVLLDSSGQIFTITGVDNRALPEVSYSSSNKNTELVLEDSGLDSQLAQGFQVIDTDTYSVLSLYLKREGNVVGNLTAKIVNDDGTGLPDLTSLVAISRSLNINTISEDNFELVSFSFSSPPTLSNGVQYHLVLSGDAAYAGSQQNNVLKFNNTGAVSYSYNAISGVVQYSSLVDLSNVEIGNFFQDNSGDLWQVNTVDDTNDNITLEPGLAVDDSGNSYGHILANDNILVGADSATPSYASGEMSRYDGTFWSNSTQGPNQFTSEHDAIFTIKGPKSIIIESNLTPILGEGSTISKRYYDDDEELSFVLGVTEGTITSATDVSAYGKGTVGGNPNTYVDYFVFRTSKYTDDIINLRLNEIPQLSADDIKINIFGGVS